MIHQVSQVNDRFAAEKIGFANHVAGQFAPDGQTRFPHVGDEIDRRAGAGRSRINEIILPPPAFLKIGQHPCRPSSAHRSAFHNQCCFAAGTWTLHFRPSAATSHSFQRRTRLRHVSPQTGFLWFNIAYHLPNYSGSGEISVMTPVNNSGLVAISRTAAVLSHSSSNRQTSVGMFPCPFSHANVLRVGRPALRHNQ